MHRTKGGLTAAAAATYAFVLWGHVALADAGRFALFLACVTGAVLTALARAGVPASPTIRLDPVAAAGDVERERETLRRLEAELHALEDQLASSSAGFAAAAGARGGPDRG